MAWIKVVDVAEAEGALREVYQEVARWRGRIANIYKAHSVSPEAMRAHRVLYRRLMFGPSELTRREREVLALAVSTANACHY